MKELILFSVLCFMLCKAEAQKLYEANQQALDSLWENSNSNEWHFNNLDDLIERDGIPTIKLHKSYGSSSYGYPISEINLSNNNIKGKLPNFTTGMPAGYKSVISSDDNVYAFQITSPIIKFSHNEITGFSPFLAYTSMGKITELWLDNNNITDGYIGSEDKVKGGLNNLFYGLKSYCIHNNELISFPLSNLGLDEYFTGYSSIANKADLVRVDNNRITFNDLIPLKSKLKECTSKVDWANVGNPDFKFIYSPQKSVGGENIEETLAEGESKTLSFDLPHPGNVYTWTLNGMDLPLSKVNDFTIEALSTDNAGVYRCKVTNPEMTDLTLYSFDMAVWLKKEGNNNPSDITLTNNEAIPGTFRFAVIGSFDGTDPDNDKLYFRLDDKVADNAMFRIINGNTLVCADELFTVPYINDYTIKVQAYDIYGGKFEKEFSIVKGDGEPDVAMPIDVTISKQSFPENTIGYVIDTVDAVGVANSDFTFSLPEDILDNNRFYFDIDSLKVKEKFNYESAKDRYLVRVKISSGDSFELYKDLELWVTDLNDSPSEIILVGGEVVYNSTPGTHTGMLVATDEDPTDTDFTFEFCEGDGDDDNMQFIIEGSFLKTKTKFASSDIGDKSVRIKALDDEGAFVEKIVKVKIKDIPVSPDAKVIEISDNSCEENQEGKVKVGTLTIKNGDFNNFTFAFSSGEGDTDNDKFFIENNIIYTNEPLNFESKRIFYIRISASKGSEVLYKAADISVIDINEAPESIHTDNALVDSEWPVEKVVANLVTIDPDGDKNFTYEITGGAHSEYFSLESNSVKINKSLSELEQNKLVINVKSSDDKGESVTKEIKFYMPAKNNENSAPTAIGINNFILHQSWEAGTEVCMLIAKDTESSANHTFSLVEEENTDNSYFIIKNDVLVLNKALSGDKTSYRVVIKASDLAGESFNQEFTFYIPTQVNGEDIIQLSDVSAYVYPNPVTDNLNCKINSDYSGSVDIHVLDVKGKIISSKSTEKTSGEVITAIDMKSLKQGVYFVKFVINHRTETIKVFKD